MKQRILMNAADSSPGGGQAQGAPAPSANASAPSQSPNPQAQGDGLALTIEALTPVLRQLVRDAINADTRRASSGKQTNPSNASKSGNNGASAPMFDPARYRELDRAVTRAGMAETLSGSAYKRMERAFSDENPDDAEAWVTDYFAGLGVAKTSTPNQTANTATTQQATQTPAPQGQPVSDRGAPPAPKVPLEEADLVTMSEADRNALIKSKGLKWYRETLSAQLKGKTVVLRR